MALLIAVGRLLLLPSIFIELRESADATPPLFPLWVHALFALWVHALILFRVHAIVAIIDALILQALLFVTVGFRHAAQSDQVVLQPDGARFSESRHAIHPFSIRCYLADCALIKSSAFNLTVKHALSDATNVFLNDVLNDAISDVSDAISYGLRDAVNYGLNGVTIIWELFRLFLDAVNTVPDEFLEALLAVGRFKVRHCVQLVQSLIVLLLHSLQKW